MALNYQTGDYSSEFNSVYKITLDMSNWDKTTIQVVPPMSGALIVYGSNDGGFVQGVTQGNAELATNFNLIQATNIATNTASSTISAAGNYSVPINAQFLRIQGSPAAAGTNVYKLLLNHSKIS